eukprot:scaffold178504_cov38-Prasinocladus_malaysianus.AAC.1
MGAEYPTGALMSMGQNGKPMNGQQAEGGVNGMANGRNNVSMDGGDGLGAGFQAKQVERITRHQLIKQWGANMTLLVSSNPLPDMPKPRKTVTTEKKPKKERMNTGQMLGWVSQIIGVVKPLLAGPGHSGDKDKARRGRKRKVYVQLQVELHAVILNVESATIPPLLRVVKRMGLKSSYAEHWQ